MHARRRLPIQVPPAGAVVAKCRTPSGLHSVGRSTPRGRAGDEALAGHGSGGIEVRDPQLGAVPRHVRQVPREPGELRAVGGDPRRRRRSRDRPRRSTASPEPSAGTATSSFTTPSVLMALADARSPAIRPASPGRRRTEPPAGVRRDRHGRGARILAIEPLVGEVREEDDAAMHGVRAAAVLVHLRPDVETFRRDVGGRADTGRRGRPRTAALRRAALEPVRDAVLQPQLPQPDAAARRASPR